MPPQKTTGVMTSSAANRGIAVKLLGLNGAKKSGHGILAKAILAKKGREEEKVGEGKKWKTKSKASWDFCKIFFVSVRFN